METNNPNNGQPPEKRDKNLNLKPFTSDNQPSGEAKSKGWDKRRFNRDILQNMLGLNIEDLPLDSFRDELIEKYGEGVKEMSIGQLMSMVQLKKAVKKGDTGAYYNVLNQAFGYPKESKDVNLTTDFEINIGGDNGNSQA
ncbi:MAG TPA: hypothetical protein VD794_02915 [Flavisolibacter sp.]|nr:hypothetical protein [Flavisolibacter sp.]